MMNWLMHGKHPRLESPFSILPFYPPKDLKDLKDPSLVRVKRQSSGMGDHIDLSETLFILLSTWQPF